MSNPFSNQISINSSQYLSNKSNISKIKTLSCKRQKCLKSGFIIKNNEIKQAPSHTALMNFTKGFFLTKPHCYSIRNKAHELTDGRYTNFDFDNIKIRNDGLDRCDYIPNYEFDHCRVSQGKIVPLANIAPKFKTKLFKTHTKMNIKCSDCDTDYKNNETCPIIHDVDCLCCHSHYFPTNVKDINYTHKHKDFNSHCCGEYPKCGHGPYPHVNRYATNQYYIARKHNSISRKNIKKRFNLKPKKKPHQRKNVRNPYMGKGYSGKLRCNCKKPKQCKCV